MKTTFTLLIVFSILFFFRTTTLAADVVSATPVIEKPLTQNPDSISKLETQIELIRNENYQQAIQSAQDAASKADRLLNWLVALFTFSAGGIAIIAFLVGKDLNSKLKELGTHVVAARKNAERISQITKQAERMDGKLKTTFKDLDETLVQYRKEISSTKKVKETDLTELENKIETLKATAAGTVSQIEALKNSATFLSNATYGLPITSGAVSLTEPLGATESLNDLTTSFCSRCYKPIASDTGSLGVYHLGQQEFCDECESKQ